MEICIFLFLKKDNKLQIEQINKLKKKYGKAGVATELRGRGDHRCRSGGLVGGDLHAIGQQGACMSERRT
jgi:hypothetical protein